MSRETTTSAKATEIRISGYGGQGIILAGLLLGKAAAIYDGKEAVLTQSYGPEARGGASCTDVIISDTPIDYPLVSHPDVLVALFQEAYVKFRPQLKPGGALIIETQLVHPENGEVFHGVPATEMADELGKRIVMNVIVLGYLVGKTDVVSREAAESAIQATVKRKTLDLNLKAFDAGFARARNGN